MRTLRLLSAALLVGLLTVSCDRGAMEEKPQADRFVEPGEAGDGTVITASAQGGGGESGGSGGVGLKMEPIRNILPPSEDGKIPSFTWDLAEERNPNKIGWPKDKGNNKVYAIEGDFDFHLKVKDGKNFDGRVRQVQSRRSGGLIEGIEITTQPQATEEAYTRAKGMLDNLGFGQAEKDKLEAWYAKAKAGDFNNLDLTFKNSYDRIYTVHVINDGTSELPWSVGLDIDWTKVCGCHG
jgi:hypothetical protein